MSSTPTDDGNLKRRLAAVESQNTVLAHEIARSREENSITATRLRKLEDLVSAPIGQTQVQTRLVQLEREEDSLTARLRESNIGKSELPRLTVRESPRPAIFLQDSSTYITPSVSRADQDLPAACNMSTQLSLQLLGDTYPHSHSHPHRSTTGTDHTPTSRVSYSGSISSSPPLSNDMTIADAFVLLASQAPDIAAATLNEGPQPDEDATPPRTENNDEWPSEFHPSGINADDQSDITDEETDNTPQDTLPMHAQGLLKSFGSYEDFIDALIKEELQSTHTLNGVSYSHIEIVAKMGLMTMDRRLVRSLICGTLPRSYRTDPGIRQNLNTLWKLQDPKPVATRKSIKSGSVRVQPVMYIQYIADRCGLGLDTQQIRTLVRQLRHYCDTRGSSQYAYQVDTFKPSSTISWNKSWSEEGLRKHLSREIGAKPLEQRINVVKQFCSALEGRLNTESQPELQPLREVGYTSSAYERLRDHYHHRQSNFLLNLVDSICAIEFPGVIHLHQFVVALIDAPAQAVIMEIMLTRLVNGYTFSGFGLSFHNAGQSNNSALTFSREDYLDFKVTTDELGTLAENHASEMQMWEAQKSEGEALRREYEVLEAQIAFLHDVHRRWKKEKEERELAKRKLIDLNLKLAGYRAVMDMVEVAFDIRAEQKRRSETGTTP